MTAALLPIRRNDSTQGLDRPTEDHAPEHSRPVTHLIDRAFRNML